MLPTDKWIEGFGPDSDARQLALAALEVRLAAVTDWLPAAAYCADHDVENVHKLRVSTRRALAALKLFSEWLPSKRARRLKKQLKKIRQVAGLARDLDVFAERLNDDPAEGAELVSAEVATRRREVQPDIESVADWLRQDGRLLRKVRKLQARVARQTAGGSSAPIMLLGDWAKQQLAARAKEFIEAVPADDHDLSELHEFRIQGKELRYMIEMLACGLDPDIREKHYRVIEELQEHLGKVNDHFWAATQLREWISDSTDHALVQAFEAAAQRETERMEETLREFREWWSPERIEGLRRGLDSEAEPSASRRRTILVS